MSKTANVTAASMLAELATHVRQCTLQFLNVPHESWLTWTPAGTSNHVLWHAGHVLWAQDLLTVEQLTEKSELPKGWAERFGSDSHPANTADWPAIDEIRALLESQLNRVHNLLTTHAERIAKEANRVSKTTGWPLLEGMIHGWHDEARHQGEMYLLLKMRRAAG